MHRHSVTSLETAHSLANDPSLNLTPGIAASPISLLPMVAVKESLGGA